MRCLLNILCSLSGLDLGKCLSISSRNFLPMLVVTAVLNGGLYQSMSLFLFLLLLVLLLRLAAGCGLGLGGLDVDVGCGVGFWERWCTDV